MLSYRLPILRHRLEPCQWRFKPLAGLQDYWYDDQLIFCLSFQGEGQFFLVAIARSNIIGAYTSEKDAGRPEAIFDLLIKFSTCVNVSIKPPRKSPIAFELREMLPKAIK